jgi:hypothetical protein
MSATALQPTRTFAIEEADLLLGRAEEPLIELILAMIDASKARGISLADWVTAIDQRPAQWQLNHRHGQGAIRVVTAADAHAPSPQAPPAAQHHGGLSTAHDSCERLPHGAVDPFLDIYAPIAAQLVGL